DRVDIDPDDVRPDGGLEHWRCRRTERRLGEGGGPLGSRWRNEQAISSLAPESLQPLGQEVVQATAERERLIGQGRRALRAGHRRCELERVERIAARRLVYPLQGSTVEVEARPGSKQSV